MTDEDSLHEMLNEKRRLEFIACAADNAVLQQNLRIKKRFGWYPVAFHNQYVKPDEKKAAVLGVEAAPLTVAAVVRGVCNGEAVSFTHVKGKVRVHFPGAKDSAIHGALSSPHFERTGEKGNYLFRKQKRL